MLSSRTAQSLYQRSYFLSSTFFDIFLSFPNAFLKAFHPHAVRFPAAFLLVHRFIWLLKSCCLARQLIYNTTLLIIVNTFFRFFSKNFFRFLIASKSASGGVRRANEPPPISHGSGSFEIPLFSQKERSQTARVTLPLRRQRVHA